MSRVRTLNTEEDYRRFERFLLAHSGTGKTPQCPRHPTIARMTYPQLAKAMQKELGFVPVRESVTRKCRELGIPRRRDPGPPPLSDEARQRALLQRDQRYRDRLRKDPVAWKAHLGRKRIACKRAMGKLRMDPVAWEAFLKRRREYLRDYRRRVREASAAA